MKLINIFLVKKSFCKKARFVCTSYVSVSVMYNKLTVQ